jgi:hypothetical protein
MEVERFKHRHVGHHDAPWELHKVESKPPVALVHVADLHIAGKPSPEICHH